MNILPWSEAQKKAFLQMQSEAQTRHYRERYPNASFDLIKLGEQSVGRFYVADLEDEIRIIDLAFLPAFYDRKIYVLLVMQVLRKAALNSKPVRIHLEYNDPQTEIFVAAGFQKIETNGLYFLWESQPSGCESDFAPVATI